MTKKTKQPLISTCCSCGFTWPIDGSGAHSCAEHLNARLLASSQVLGKALAACRSINFAVTNSARFGGEYNLNDILAADHLATDALTANRMLNK